MEMLKNKTATIAIALILMLTISIPIFALPAANAHSPPWQIPTYAYLSVQPTPVGVGQNIYVSMWINQVPPTAANVYGDLWHNYTLTITKPDGTVETQGPFTSDHAGAHAVIYTANKVGNYTFVFKFGGDTVLGANPGPTGTSNAAFVGDYYMPSTSQPVTVTVREEPVSGYPSNPLPTGYWERPIYASGNIGWYQISGNWLGLRSTQVNTGAYSNAQDFNPYTTAPNTAHIVWTKPIAFGGVIGGEFGGSEESSYYSTSHREPKFEPVILNGVLYYTQYPGSVTYPEGWAAVDIRTGKTLWTQNISTPLRMGQVLAFQTFDQYGGTPFLWGGSGSTYSMYDAMTGNWILDIVNGVSMTFNEAKDGSLLGYYVNATDKTLNLWNSTSCVMNYGNATGQQTSPTRWLPTRAAKIDFKYGIQWSKPLATNISGVPFTTLLSVTLIDSDVVLMTSSDTGSWQPGWRVEAGYSASTGEQLWLVNRTLTPWTRLGGLCAYSGVYAYCTYETGIWTAYSITTGQKLWETVKPAENDPWALYCNNGIIAYGQLNTIGYGGYIRSYNITNGNLLWTFFTGSSGAETVYGTWPLWVAYDRMSTIADGKILVGGGHEYSPPMFQGSQFWVVNTTTGEKVWSILSFAVTSPAAVSDGYLVYFNSYDNQVYSYGKGPSQVTVTAPQTAVEQGKPLVISGTVMDISAGANQQVQTANFPNGLPCVSDASMSQWMEYVYMQQPKPNNATGVPVSIDVIDSNGNFRNIGKTTSDASGKFSFTWTPDIPGDYSVIATFAGSESYYSSFDEAFFTASAPAPTASPYPVTTLPPTEMYFAASTAAIIIAIAIVGTVIVLMLRKRPQSFKP